MLYLVSTTMPLRLYNTLTRKKQLFRPRHGKTVSLYTCGPTVYHYAHIGNLRTYIFEDVLKRVLQFNGFRVRHVMNITDVGHLTDDQDQGEDKMEVGAQREHRSVWEIAQLYTTAFQEDLERLNILAPTIWCKATDHITEQIRMILELEQRGFAYPTDDGVYFDTSKFTRYGELARLQLKGLKAGARVEMVKGKKNPSDFALWKFSYPNGRSFDPAQDDGARRRQMEWPSPWGVGFPGWHIECSAMSMKYLPPPIDIHCGGIDHIPVHHTNEIAQAEAATGKRPFVRFWIHGAHMTIRASKMAKSENNFLTVSSLANDGFDPLAFRLLTYSAHYRTTLDFTLSSMATAAKSLEHLRNALREKGVPSVKSSKKLTASTLRLMKKFKATVNDDLNMPEAMAVVWESIRLCHNASELRALVEGYDSVLALQLLRDTPLPESVSTKVTQLAQVRDQARKEKNWARSDALRKEIEQQGYSVEDSPQGTRLKSLGPKK